MENSKFNFALYKEQLLDNLAKCMIENVFVMSTFVATTLTIVKIFYPHHYNEAVEMTTAWLAVKRGH